MSIQEPLPQQLPAVRGGPFILGLYPREHPMEALLPIFFYLDLKNRI